MNRPHCAAHAAVALTLLATGCGPEGAAPASEGRLAFALDDAPDRPFELAYAGLTITGPVSRSLTLDARGADPMDLPAGVYDVAVAEDFRVVARDAPERTLPAQLVGENPITLLVAPDTTTALTLRFELESPPTGAVPTGALSVATEIADEESPAACARHLRITELDYDQEGADSREFVEVGVVNACEASLDDVTLELVNGSDGSVYARYALGEASARLAPDTPLVVGDADVVAGLTVRTPHLALSGAGLQNGPDAVRLVRGTELLDSVAYEGAVSGLGHGAPAPADEGAQSLTRCTDTADDGRDFALRTPSPGTLAACSAAATP